MRKSAVIDIIVLILFFLNIQPSMAQSPYELKESTDGVLIGLGIPFAMFGFSVDLSVKSLSEDEIGQIRREDVNKFDRFSTYFYSEKAAKWSDILVLTCIAVPFTLLFSERIQDDTGTILTMYAESILFAASLPSLSKGVFRRMRPFVYNPDVALEKKMSANARKSFFSGHTSVAFAAMIFLSTVHSKYYPDSDWKPFIWGSTILLASSVGYLRIIAGAHFPSDVIVGALVGSAVGYLIPRIHETDTSNTMLHINHVQPIRPIFSVRFAF